MDTRSSFPVETRVRTPRKEQEIKGDLEMAPDGGEMHR